LATPWVLDTVNNRCLLNCIAGYSLYLGPDPAKEVFDQHCVASNCKAWEQAFGTPEQCTECWSRDDVDNYSTWRGSISYDEQEILGRDANNPFSLSYIEKNSLIKVHHNAEPIYNRSQICQCQDGQTWNVSETPQQIPYCYGGKHLGPMKPGGIMSRLKVWCPTEYHGSKMHV
jgi:hypothetical protein